MPDEDVRTSLEAWAKPFEARIKLGAALYGKPLVAFMHAAGGAEERDLAEPLFVQRILAGRFVIMVGLTSLAHCVPKCVLVPSLHSPKQVCGSFRRYHGHRSTEAPQ